MRHQSGCIVRDAKRRCWFGRWYENVVQPDGSVKRQLRNRKLADFSDQYRTKNDVRPLLDEILRPLNTGKVDARSTMTITQFVENYYVPFVKNRDNMKPSTANGYQREWKGYLKPRIGNIVLRDFRTVDAANVLNDLARHGLNNYSLKHAKSLMSGIFTYAKNVGVLDGINPVYDAMIPKNAKPKSRTHAATLDEVLDMLDALKGKPKARAAIALMFFAGLRPGEARGVTWEDYEPIYNHEKQQWEWWLTPRHSVWRTFTTDPKTSDSAKPVLVIEPLRLILAELRAADAGPNSGPILRGKKGKPLHLDNLAKRQIVPALKAKAIDWRGYYAFRRGIGTRATAETKDPLAAKGLLRHSNVATTQAHYIKDVPENTRVAMQLIEQRTLALQAKRDSQAATSEPIAEA
jgi:integrase